MSKRAERSHLNRAELAKAVMSTSIETAHTVAAVLSVFHNAADLMKQISKKTKKKKSEQAFKQKFLLETLEAGEIQISQRYGQYLEELGDGFKTGDGMF